MSYIDEFLESGLLPKDSIYHTYILKLLGDEDPLVEILDLPSEAVSCYLASCANVHELIRIRAELRSQKLAAYLIDSQGELDHDRLEEMIVRISERKEIFYFEGDALINRHILQVLQIFKKEQTARRSLHAFSLPLAHRKAENLIRECLNISASQTLTLRDVRCAVLSSCLTLLRQNVGSCFATAPAIMIHEEQLEIYLDDLSRLLSRGTLSRVIGGIEYAVPLSQSWGGGDLHKAVTNHIFFSPALISAFENVQLISSQDPLREKIAKARELVSSYIEERIGIEEIIDRVIYEQCGVTKEEIDRLQKQQKLNLRNRTYSPSFFEDVLEKKALAKSCFKRMTDHPLLKSWEFTMASFAECTTDFSRWNLYASLGLNPEEKHGIGEVIYRDLDTKLDEENEKVRHFQQEYEYAFSRVKMVEGLFKNVTSQDQLRRLKSEHQSHLYQMRVCLEMRDKHHKTAQALAKFFSFLIEEYQKRFLDYFQELYDPQMGEGDVPLYDDRPAGFRLVYKHGRHEPLTWTSIQGSESYVEALADFFNLVESQIEALVEEKRLKEELRRVTTEIIHHVRTEEFLVSASKRTELVQKVRLPSQFSTEKKKVGFVNRPWAYISGGSMENLLSIYCKREVAWTKEEKVIDEPLELLTFFLETLKELPPLITDLFQEDSRKSLLVSSPTHAFTFLPGLQFFMRGWTDRGFTYTWIRDQLITPRKQFYQSLSFSRSEQDYLIEQLASRLPPLFAHQLQRRFLSSSSTMATDLFRNQLIETMEGVLQADDIDAFLYEMLPITEGKRVQEIAQTLFPEVSNAEIKKTLKAKRAPKFFGAYQFVNFARSLFPELNQELPSFLQKMRDHQLLCPEPLLFADTNWADQFFAFMINPSTLELELWRTDLYGLRAAPMQRWCDHLKEKPWVLYTHPHEYQLELRDVL